MITNLFKRWVLWTYQYCTTMSEWKGQYTLLLWQGLHYMQWSVITITKCVIDNVGLFPAKIKARTVGICTNFREREFREWFQDHESSVCENVNMHWVEYTRPSELWIKLCENSSLSTFWLDLVKFYMYMRENLYMYVYSTWVLNSYGYYANLMQVCRAQ